MSDKPKSVEELPTKTVTTFTFPELGVAVEAETLGEATKIATKKAEGNE